MTDLDDRLRTILHDDGFAMQVWDDPVARVTTGIRRKRRNRTLAVATAVMALAVAVPAAVLWPSAVRPQLPSGPIAYVDGELVAAPALARRSPRPDASPCEKLGNHWVQGNTLFVTSRDFKRCTLSASASFDNGVTGGGQFPGGGAKQYPATVDPGEPARMDLVFTECDRETKAIVLGEELSLGKRCVSAASDWYVEPPLLNTPLTVSMEAPDTVQPGQYFDYIVTLLNATPHAFGLDVCPTYLQKLGEEAIWRRLNCAGLTEIPAHTPVSFAMRAYVPESQPVGAKLKLEWMAVMSDGKVAIADLATAGVTVEVT